VCSRLSSHYALVIRLHRYDVGRHTQRFYLQHTDDILCLGLHPDGTLAATGQIGKSPPIHVWDVKTMATKAVLAGFHNRGVCALDFSPDGKRLVSVGLDDDHCICVWDWRSGAQLASTRGHKDKIFVVRYNPVTEGEVGDFCPCRRIKVPGIVGIYLMIPPPSNTHHPNSPFPASG